MKMPPHVVRMQVESQQLTDRVERLDSFIKGDAFGGLGSFDQMMLRLQLGAMKQYDEILTLRLDRAIEDL